MSTATKHKHTKASLKASVSAKKKALSALESAEQDGAMPMSWDDAVAAVNAVYGKGSDEANDVLECMVDNGFATPQDQPVEQAV